MLDMIFGCYLVAAAMVKALIFARCRKKPLGCSGKGCRFRWFCRKHNLSPLDEDILKIEECLFKNKSI